MTATPLSGDAARVRWIGRAACSVASQTLSSTTNFLLTVLIAVVAPAETLGRTMAVVSVYLLALTVARSLFTEELVVGGAGVAVEAAAWRRARRNVLAVGVVGAGFAVGIGIVVELGPVPLAMMAIAIPALLVQDAQRYLAWASGRPGLAVVLDGIWLVVSAGLLAIAALASAGLSASAIIAAWAGGGFLAWLTGRLLVEAPAVDHDPPAPVGGPAMRFRALAHSQALMAAAVNLGPILVAVALSPTMAAALKSAILPFTPILSLIGGLRVVTLPAMRRAIEGGDPAKLVGVVTGGVAGAAVGSIAAVFVVASVPDELRGEALNLVRPHLPAAAVLCVLFVTAQLLSDAVALRWPGEAVGRRVLAIVAEWSLLVIGASVGGVGGLVIGWTLGVGLATAVWLGPALRPPRNAGGHDTPGP